MDAASSLVSRMPRRSKWACSVLWNVDEVWPELGDGEVLQDKGITLTR
jgi:hypothetical protein